MQKKNYWVFKISRFILRIFNHIILYDMTSLYTRYFYIIFFMDCLIANNLQLHVGYIIFDWLKSNAILCLKFKSNRADYWRQNVISDLWSLTFSLRFLLVIPMNSIMLLLPNLNGIACTPFNSPDSVGSIFVQVRSFNFLRWLANKFILTSRTDQVNS